MRCAGAVWGVFLLRFVVLGWSEEECELFLYGEVWQGTVRVVGEFVYKDRHVISGLWFVVEVLFYRWYVGPVRGF